MSGAGDLVTCARVQRRGFFCVRADELAPKLLGLRLVRTQADGTRLAGEIVEVEAYLGVKDRACHTFGGRRTARNEAMYGPAGTAYVYLTYGMHHCVNVVCGVGADGRGGGVGEAVLIRALGPVEGMDVMRQHRSAARRKGRTALADRDLCSGPGKLCQALCIDRALNGVDLLGSASLALENSPAIFPRRIVRASRVGVESAGEWAERRLRWFFDGCEHVSVGRADRRSEHVRVAFSR